MMMNRSRIFIALVVFAIAAVAGVFGFLYFKKPSSELNKPDEIAELRKSVKLAGIGNYTDSNTALQGLAMSANEPIVAFFAKAQMGVNYFYELGKDNQKKGIETEKQLINDKSVPSSWRAYAVDRIIDFENDGTFSLDVQEEILKGPPFDFITARKRGDVLKALAEYSNALYLNSYATEVIAGTYRFRLLNNLATDPKIKAEYIDKLEKLLKQSEKLFESERNTFFASKVLDALFYDAHGSNEAALALVNPNFDKTAFEKSFKKGLEILSGPELSGGLVSQQFGSFIHFFYAQYVAELYGESRIDEIREHLSAVIKLSVINPRNTFPFLVELELKEPNTFTYNSFLKLASLSPEFKAYLKERSWSVL